LFFFFLYACIKTKPREAVKARQTALFKERSHIFRSVCSQTHALSFCHFLKYCPNVKKKIFMLNSNKGPKFYLWFYWNQIGTGRQIISFSVLPKSTSPLRIIAWKFTLDLLRSFFGGNILASSKINLLTDVKMWTLLTLFQEGSPGMFADHKDSWSPAAEPCRDASPWLDCLLHSRHHRGLTPSSPERHLPFCHQKQKFGIQKFFMSWEACPCPGLDIFWRAHHLLDYNYFSQPRWWPAKPIIPSSHPSFSSQ